MDTDAQNRFPGADSRNNASAFQGDAEEQLRSLQFIRALDKAIAGIILLSLLLNIKYMTDVLPVPCVQYAYLLPVLLIFNGVLTFPKTGYKLLQYGRALERLTWSSSALLFLSPFLNWWMQDSDSIYLLYNFLILCMLASVFLVHLSNLVHAVSKEDNMKGIAGLSRWTRYAALYLMLAPAIAFFVTVAFGRSSGPDISYFFFRLEPWKLLVFFSPVILTLICLIRLRLEKYRKMK